MIAGMQTVAAYNAIKDQPQYSAINGVFCSLLLGLLILKRLGFAYLAGLLTVALPVAGSLILIGDQRNQLSAAFVAMPILIASSLTWLAKYRRFAATSGGRMATRHFSCTSAAHSSLQCTANLP
jgi:hypothetical protein